MDYLSNMICVKGDTIWKAACCNAKIILFFSCVQLFKVFLFLLTGVDWCGDWIPFALFIMLLSFHCFWVCDSMKSHGPYVYSRDGLLALCNKALQLVEPPLWVERGDGGGTVLSATIEVEFIDLRVNSISVFFYFIFIHILIFI